MTYAETHKKIKELEHYIDLSSQLEQMVDDSFQIKLKGLTDILKNRLDSYMELASLEEKSLRKRAEAEGKLEQEIYTLAETRGIEIEEARKISEKENKKSDNQIRLDYIGKIIKYTILFIYVTPFSREMSQGCADIVRSYTHTLKTLQEIS